MARYSAKTIASWFVAWAEAEGADLSNLKLQKLLYYAQGHHLALYGEALFGDDIQAWSHGPVVPDIYRAYKHFGSADVQLDDEDPFRWDDVDTRTTQLLLRVWHTYAQYSAWGLRNKTHEEPPWRDTFRGGIRNLVIPKDAMKQYFQQTTT